MLNGIQGHWRIGMTNREQPKETTNNNKRTWRKAEKTLYPLKTAKYRVIRERENIIGTYASIHNHLNKKLTQKAVISGIQNRKFTGSEMVKSGIYGS